MSAIEPTAKAAPSFSGLFSTKSVNELMEVTRDPNKKLTRALGTLEVTLLGVGAIVGAGIFTTIGTAAVGDALRPGAGPSLILSFFITAVACSFTALCYAELASMVPVSGSAYTYTYASLGELIAWVIGWDLMFEYAISNVAVAISWANYFRAFLHGIGIDVPIWLTIDYRTASRIPGLVENAPHVFGIPIVLNLLAFSITAALTVLLVWGIRESTRFNNAMVILKILVLLFFVGAAWSLVPSGTMTTNWQPFFPNGWTGTFSGAAIVFFAFIGFDTISTVAEETRQPERTLPRGIFASLAIRAFLYIMVAAAFTGMVPQAELAKKLVGAQGEPLTVALNYVAPSATWITTVIALGAVIAQTVTLLVYQMGQPRIFFSMARDGLMPQAFAALHPRFNTPHVTTILTGAFVAIASTFVTIDELIDLTNIGTLFAFTLVCIGIPVLRYRAHDTHRPFKVPFGPFVMPSLGTGSCIFLMWYLPPTSWWRFFGWLTLGLAVYALYGYSRSVLGRRLGRSPRPTNVTRTVGVGCLLATVGLFAMPHDASFMTVLHSAIRGGEQDTYVGVACLALALVCIGGALGASAVRRRYSAAGSD